MLWLVGPSTQPADLGSSLIEHGLSYTGTDPGMAIALDRLPSDLGVPSGFSREPVQDLSTLRTWCRFTDQTLVAEALFAWGQTLSIVHRLSPKAGTLLRFAALRIIFVSGRSLRSTRATPVMVPPVP
jgi:hypothetical protein